jgi:pSer/pThr/pTyr-binding forkhead associated (FHA) protein
MGMLELGVVCGRCDTYAAMGSAACASCGNDLALFPTPKRAPKGQAAQSLGPRPPANVEAARAGRPNTLSRREDPAPAMAAPAAADSVAARGAPRADGRNDAAALFDQPLRRRSPARGTRNANEASRLPAAPEGSAQASPQPLRRAEEHNPSLEELMDQAKNFICRSCSTPVPLQHKFCGRCGAAVPAEILNARTQFFGQLQIPGRAKLILIRGEGVEGLSYQLNAETHLVGRSGQLVFPDDPFVSPKHANLFYKANKLYVHDEGSLNGVFVRVRGTVDIAMGDHFLAGEQVFRVDATPKASDGPAPDGTYFYSSPKHQSPFRIVQILQGGAIGMCVCAKTGGLQLGREGGDLNFPADLYMSAAHCKLEDVAGKITLTDLNSRNGTYVRVKQDKELVHGDYLFIGRKLLRVEINAAALA